jgi:putative transcriptional regulator
MIRYKLKERIAEREFQERRRITLQEIADKTGIGRITLSRMLGHRTHVRSDTLDKLCAYFGCRIEELLDHVADAPKKRTGHKRSD